VQWIFVPEALRSAGFRKRLVMQEQDDVKLQELWCHFSKSASVMVVDI
jgi:hypothetical protein